MELLQELLLLNEAKPRRAWEGKIKRIDDLLRWMYDKDILTDAEKKRKDTVINQYYRYYNDGDMPAVLKNKGFSKYTPEEKVETALEEYLEEFVKKLLSKYFSKVDRREFRIDNAIDELETVSSVAEHHDAHGLLTYWLKETKIKDEEGELADLTSKLEGQYDKLIAAVNKVNKEKNTGISYRRKQMQKDNTWTDAFEKDYVEMTKTIDEMKKFIDNLIEGLKKLKKTDVVKEGLIFEAAMPGPDDYRDFKTALEKLATKIQAANYEEVPQVVADEVYKKLDKPFWEFIDGVLAGGKYDKAKLDAALKRGEQKEGTEPRAAIDGAIMFMKMALKKV